MSRGTCRNQLVDHILKLLTYEDGDDRWRCLLSAETVVVARNSRRLAEQIRMAVNCFHNAGKNKQELDILMRSHARIQHVDAGVGSQGPVVMFTGTIDALERFFMEQARHSVTACNLFHCFHNELVVINGKVCLCVDRCEFMLCRSDLVVLGLCGNAQLPELFI